MGTIIEVLSIAKTSTPITRGHLSYASEVIGTSQLGWFEDKGASKDLVLFDATKYSITEMQELYRPYYQNEYFKENEWISTYRFNYGWKEEMIFEISNPTVSGVVDDIEEGKNYLVVQNMGSTWIPLEGKLTDGVEQIEEFCPTLEKVWIEESLLAERNSFCKLLPQWKWGDVTTYFNYETNGDKNAGYITVDESGAVISDDTISRMQSELAAGQREHLRKEAPWIL